MRKGDDVVMKATVEAMKEKILENQHKPPLTSMTYPEALSLMKDEIREVLEELAKDPVDVALLRRELADVVIFAGAAIVDCDRLLFIEKVIK